ncbi:glycosyltransferase [Longitalea arenae]|uniref:glycosyltransferase n=1 Tax=Longitalea arenae TaxID=2812558 RepID=UPI00196713DD|nr:glycosyltransferase [Longitalea arenae]
MSNRKTILLFADWYEPGYKAGGPIRSCVHFVHQMKDRYSIYVFTTDRDLNDTSPYINIPCDQWLEIEKSVKIFYCSPQKLGWTHIHRQIKSISPDYIYLNSMYSRHFTIYPLMMRRLGIIKSSLVLAPRGMLKESALQFKSAKKKLFLSAFRRMGLHRFIHFHATDKTELADVKKYFGHNAKVTLASNFPGMINDYPGSIKKTKHELSVIFIGRLHPVKNLDFLLRVLKNVIGNVSLTIVGNAEDENYVNHCKTIVKGFGPNIKVYFAGEIPNNELGRIISQHHIFALPTQGENFGHAIFESLAAGKPVLISDQTPWRNLYTVRAGWDISLQQPEQFTKALQEAVLFDQNEYDALSRGAWEFVRRFVQQSELQTAYNNIFS